MEANKVLTVLFERKLLRIQDDIAVYQFFPIDIVEAKELNFDGIKIIQTKDIHEYIEKECKNEEIKQYEFSFIGDYSNSIERYGFGFSIILSKETPSEIRNHKKQMANTIKDLRNYPLIHIIDYTSNDEQLILHVGKYNFKLNAENYFELSDIVNVANKLSEKKEVKEEKKIETPHIIVPKGALYSNEIYEEVSKTVINQDEQIKGIATALAKNSRIKDSSLKRNILVCGPTGVGKTEIFRVVRDSFGIPITIEDSGEYTAAGYKGKDVNEILLHLLDNANGDITKAERGIVVFDEVDKKAATNNEHEIYTTAVIKSLLTMAEGHTYILNVPGQGEIPFDTSHVTFSFLGAFSGIEELSGRKYPCGFASPEEQARALDIHNIYNDKTLATYGLPPEFLGRTSIIVMNRLNEEDLIKIIKTSNKSQLLLYKKLLEEIGMRFKYDDNVVKAIAKKAIIIDEGARSIKKIVEKALEVADYEIFSNNNYKELIISEETIENNKKFILK